MKRGEGKKREGSEAVLSVSLPTFLYLAATYSPTSTPCSTIGAGGLNCRVRHVTGCDPSALTTRILPKTLAFNKGFACSTTKHQDTKDI